MPYVDEHDEDEEDDDPNRDDPELPDESDMDEDDDPDFAPCPYCGKRMSEEAEVCPKCRNFISREDEPARPKSLIIVIIVVLLVASLAGVVFWLR